MGPLVVALALFAAADPTAARVWAARATEAFNASRFDEALAAAEKAYALDDHPELLNNLGVVLQALGRYADAAAAFERVLADPRSSDALRARDRARLAELLPSVAVASVVFEGTEVPAVLGEAHADREGEQRTPPGSTLLLLRDRGALVARVVELPAGRRTTFVLPEHLTHPDDAFIDVGAERLRGLALDGFEFDWVPDPGSRVRLAPGRHRLAMTTREGAQTSREVTLAPGEVFVLSAAPAIVEAAVSAPPEAPVAPWIVVGSGAAVAIAGGVLLGVAHANSSDRHFRLVGESGRSRILYEEALAREQRVEREAAAGVGLMIAGGVAAMSGVVWALITGP